MKKKILILLFLMLAFFSLRSPKKVLATNCATDPDCQTNPGSTMGCYRIVKGLSSTWYCINAHPDVIGCTNDAMCNPSDPTYNSSVVGCQNIMNHWQCQTIRSPSTGEGPVVGPNTTTTTVDQNITCDSNTGIQTAIGCIHVLGTSGQFLSDILKWAIGVGGGIAFLLMLYAGFMIMTASGNPDRLKAGQELLTSAIAGLILLIFSIFILKFIGIDILGLGKFGFGT